MRRSLITLSSLGAALIGLVGTGSVVEAAHPPSPSPCAADGICRPNTTTWGHWNTHWRPWPGDKAAIPTAAAAPAGGPGEEKEEQLRGFEPPLPQKESQIGPEKSEREKAADLPAGTEPPAVPGVPDGAAPGVLPGADPLGANHLQSLPPASIVIRDPAAERRAEQPPVALPLPQDFLKQPTKIRPAAYNSIPTNVDAPPALPASLLRVAQLHRSQQATQPQVRVDANVRRTSAETAGGIHFINPAAALVTEPGTEGLQQAIYFEASKSETRK